MTSNPNVVLLFMVYTGLFFHIIVLLTGILKNPGIPQKVIKRILKERLGKSQTGEGELSDGPDDSLDLETGNITTS